MGHLSVRRSRWHTLLLLGVKHGFDLVFPAEVLRLRVSA